MIRSPSEAPGGVVGATSPNWLERFEPVRVLAPGRWTGNLLCRDRQTGQTAVVREIRPAVWWHGAERALALAAMQREAEVLAALAKSPGALIFPRLLGAALEGTAPWIAVEFLEGSTLRGLFPTGLDGRVLAERGWTAPQALQAVHSLRPGLAALHRLGEVHGLIQPGNLVVEMEAGEDAAQSVIRLRLRDLGWAGVPPGQTLAPARECLPYVWPLALRSAGPPAPRADAWSAAAILFELMAGRPAFAGQPSRFEHEERFGARRRMGRGLPPGLLPQLPHDILAFLKASFDPSGAVGIQNAGDEPLGGFFASLARCLEVAGQDPLWSRARLPNPDLERLRREIPSTQQPVSPRLLEQHEIAWGRWRSATRQVLEGFSHLAELPESGPWQSWKREIEEDADNCIRTEPADDPPRNDSEALAARLQEIERRIAGLAQICADAWQLLREPLRGAADELEAAVRQTAGGLQRKEPALVEQIGAFRREIERLSADRITPDLFPAAVRLTNEGAELRERTRQASARISDETTREREKGKVFERQQTAQVDFWQAVRGKDFEKARSILETWPGGANDTSRRLTEGLDAWRAIERETVALLAAPRTPQAVASMRQLARKLDTEPPAGFETFARPLARQLEEALESPRTNARAAVERARAFCAEQQESAARAAERSQIEGLPDRKAASSFCRALQTLERAVEDAGRRLSTTAEDADVLVRLPATIRELENDASQARQTWWPGGNLPRPESEWTAFVGKLNRLVTRGRSGIQAAHRLRETQAPAGWEEPARKFVLPPIPKRDLRKWMTLAAAAAVLVGIGALWSSRQRIVDLIDMITRPTSGPSIARATPTPPKEPDLVTPTPTPVVIHPVETAWLRGPAFAILHLRADGAKEESIRLPAEVRFPGKARVTLWLSSGQAHTRETQTEGDRGALQKSVDSLASELGDVPSHDQALDAEIELRLEDLLKGSRP